MKLYRLHNTWIIGLALFPVLIILILGLNPVLAQTPSQFPPAPTSKSILLLYSAGYHLPAYRKNMAAFMSFMDKASFPSGNIYFEDLDLIRNSSPEYRQRLVDVIHRKYANRKIDLLITIEGAARDFVLQDCQDLFPTTPLLSILSANIIKPAVRLRPMVQIPSILDMTGTLKIALSLFPETKRVFVVLGNGVDEQQWEGDAKKQFAPWGGKLDFEYSTNLTYEETLKRVASLPPKSVVLYVALYRDKTGRAFVPAEVARSVVRISPAPVFGVYDQIVGLVVGGSMISYEAEGARAARLALDILDGKFSFPESPHSLPSLTQPMFNWQQLLRWGISRHSLPEGSLVINRPPSIWTDYKKQVIGFLAIMALQAVLIISLLFMHRRRINAESNRQLAEEALRLSEEKFSKAFKTSPDAVNINRLSDGLYLDINEGFTEIMGYTREDVIGRSSLPGDLGIWVRQEDRDHLVASLKATGEAIGLEAPFRCKGGTVIYGQMSARVLEINGEACILSITRDITERKRTEEALRKSEERYRNILDSIEEGYYEVDTKGNITFFNDSLCVFVGYSRDELMGMNYHQYTDEENADKLYKAYNEVYRTGIPAKSSNYQVIRKDGTTRFGEVSVSTIRDEEGNITGFRGISRDVTERKEAEEENEKLEGQLKQAQKMESIGTLAGGIAHDFNNILMGIQGRASLMLCDIDASHPFSGHLKEIETYVKSAADLTKQLLGFAQGGRYELLPTDLNKLVDQSAILFGRTKKEISLHRKFQPGLWTVEVDKRQIEQVLLNLFVNAWQAMPAGGDLYLETGNVILEEDYLRPQDLKPGRYVRISFTDTGTGMDEATRQRVFDPFFTTKGMGRGTGLGLASAYGTIKHHQGIINVYSEKGQGSTFNIYLPASEKEVPLEKESPIDIDRGSGTVLLVDDEEMILAVSRRMLERLGYQVKVAKGGEEALKILSADRHEIALVILDMIMPGMGGGETFERIKAEHPGIKVLLSSGYSLNGQAQDILNKGCYGFIQKPFSLSELSQKIGKILGKP